MTPDDIKSRSLNSGQLLQTYQHCQILNIINMPVDDTSERLFEQGLVEAAVVLHKMVTLEKLKVFVHCTSGYNRAPAVLLVFLCLFMVHQHWRNPQNVGTWLRSHYSASYPNLKVVQQTIAKNAQITEQEMDRLNQLNGDGDRQRRILLEQQEAEKRRLAHLAEQERLRLLQEEESDRLRRIREQEEELERQRK